MVVSELQILAHKQGISLHQYLDDWVIRHGNPRVLSPQLQSVLALCSRKGLLINQRKSELQPSRDFVFVGYRYLTVKGVVVPSAERISKIKNLLALFLKGRPLPAFLW